MNKPTKTASLLRFGSSRFRYRYVGTFCYQSDILLIFIHIFNLLFYFSVIVSGRTEYQANKDSRMSARKAMRIQRYLTVPVIIIKQLITYGYVFVVSRNLVTIYRKYCNLMATVLTIYRKYCNLIGHRTRYIASAG